MPSIAESYVDLTITVCGESREVEARVEYLHSKALGAIYERGSGVPISPPEPEMAEIQRVIVTGGEADLQGKRKDYDILHLLSDAQVDAISNEILEGGR